MRTLYIVDKETWMKHTFLLDESHWIPTDDPGKILVVASFSHDGNADTWEGIADVDTLPHPFVEANVPIKDEHADILAGMGVKRGQTVMDVARAASKLSPKFKPERL